MDRDILVLIADIVGLIVIYFLGRRQSITVSNRTINIAELESKIALITNYAEAFISWAKQFMKDDKGPVKMDEVVSKLIIISERYNLDITEDEIRAIAQRTYDRIKKEWD